MKGRVIVVIVLMGAVELIALGGCVAGEKDDRSVSDLKPTFKGRDALRGLQGVGVLVAGLQPDSKACGFTKEELAADIRRQLRQHGIRVLSRKELRDTPGWPWLGVGVKVVGLKSDSCPCVVIDIEVTLNQQVLLTRDSSVAHVATTWRTGVTGPLKRDKLGILRSHVKGQVAKFIEEYLAANPRGGEAKDQSGGES